MRDQYTKSSKDYQLMSLYEAKQRLIPNQRYPSPAIRVISKPFEWGNFSSWRHAHYVSQGWDVPRISVFYRFLRENPTAANKDYRHMVDMSSVCTIRDKHIC